MPSLKGTSGVPASSALLESGQHTVETPYPPTSSSGDPDAQKIGKVQGSATSSNSIPATSAPLEGGPHTTSISYPSTTTTTGTNATSIAQNQK
ncbi:hypothetical protein BV25DRAFT_1818517 [Artomyces pyxidatus]|uniref:Uncharacterized protein n=1 Tax=Artomyces pyxidatus TaxID=48021 RepID=A0ACB8TIA1_9AGAM|nr:hypothetical protein BV25DRAFT_1818517 [Artomyces pyxidatus]